MTEVVSTLKINNGGVSRGGLIHRNDVEKYLTQNDEFTKQYVVQYLKNNPEFADEYFMNNATMDLFQNWYDKKINLRFNSSPNSLKIRKRISDAISITGADDEMLFPTDSNLRDAEYNTKTLPNMSKMFHLDGNNSNNHNRRRSEPLSSEVKKRDSDECLSTISEDVHKQSRLARSISLALPQSRYRTISSLDLNNNDDENDNKDDNDVTPQNHYPKEEIMFISNNHLTKPSLRKAQSEPTYKKNLSHLIKSSVYPGTNHSRHINIENHIGLKESDEITFLYHIVKDVSEDLALQRVCFKILTNLGLMLNVEKASIFIIEHCLEDNDKFRLLLKDVNIADGLTKESFSNTVTNIEEVPIGKGIIGHVALQMSPMIVNKIEEVKEYDATYDKWYNRSTKNALIQPIIDSEGETVAVIVAMNCKNGFVEEDKIIGSTFLTFCGIFITNALIFELTKKEFDRNKALLEFSHDVFEEQSSLNNAIQKILNKSIEMFGCKRACLMLLDETKETDERRVFSKLFQVTTEDDKTENRFSKCQRDSMLFSVDSPEATNDGNSKQKILCSTPVSSIPAAITYEDGDISVAIRNSASQVIGVLKMFDCAQKSVLSKNEEQLLEAFAIFAGLGINNCIMYDNIVKGQAHQKIGLEALSYHTGARQSDVDKLKFAVIPSCASFNLTSLKFDDFSLLDHEMLTSAIRMFMEFNFFQKFQIEYEVLCRFLITVKNNYRRVIYHNWRHAFNVTQSMYAVLTTGKMSEQFNSTECLALLVGCLCHDLDHRGTNNEFQMKTDSPLVKLYGTSTMEQHHFNCAVTILNSEGNNIFAQLPSQDYRNVMKLVKHAILATDLSNHIRLRDKFSNAIKDKNLDSSVPENRAILRSMLMTACDLSGITKPWDIQKRVVHLVTSEFFHQGDIERKKLHVEPKQMMDRKHILQLPRLQVDFFQFMGIPVYNILAEYNRNLQPLLDGAKNNQSKWAQKSRQIEQGHVDPDIEPVLHPVNQEEL